jgi:hypothetical protein
VRDELICYSCGAAVPRPRRLVLLRKAKSDPFPTANPALRRNADGAEIPSPSNPLPFRSKDSQFIPKNKNFRSTERKFLCNRQEAVSQLTWNYTDRRTVFRGERFVPYSDKRIGNLTHTAAPI